MRKTIEEWQSIIDDFAASSLNASAYCKENNLAHSTFHEYKKRLESATPQAFIKVEFPQAHWEQCTKEYTVELATKAGKLTLSGSISADYLVQLIRGIAQ